MNDDPLKERLDQALRENKWRVGEDGRVEDIPHEPSEHGQGMAMAMRVMVEFLSSVIAGTFFGYLIDKEFGTDPWCMIIGIFAGFAVGIWSIYRVLNNVPEGIVVNRDALQELKQKDLTQAPESRKSDPVQE